MRELIIINIVYNVWSNELKERIHQARLKTIEKVNSNMLWLCLSMGKNSTKEQIAPHGCDAFTKQMSQDLVDVFLRIKVFSRNLRYKVSWNLFIRH